jgi:hypothetical protein
VQHRKRLEQPSKRCILPDEEAGLIGQGADTLPAFGLFDTRSRTVVRLEYGALPTGGGEFVFEPLFTHWAVYLSPADKSSMKAFAFTPAV